MDNQHSCKNDELLQEISKIEENSKFFLKSFSFIWFAIIFLITSEILKGNTETLFIDNFKDLFTQIDLTKVAILILLFLFLKFSIQVLFNLSKNISKSRLDFQNNKETYLSKYQVLKENIIDGFFTTLLLILYLISILSINNDEFVEQIEEFILILVSLGLGIYFYLFPLYVIIFKRVLVQRKLYVKTQYNIILTYFLVLNFLILLLFSFPNIITIISQFSFEIQFYIIFILVIVLFIMGFIYNNLWNYTIGYKIKNSKNELIEKLFEN